MNRLAEALESEVRSLLREGLVVWLDSDGVYSEFVDQMAERPGDGGFGRPVFRYRGSFLELMLAMGNTQEGLDSEPMLLHVPGYNDNTIRATPLLEAYKSGRRFERALPTLLRSVAKGQVSASEVESYVSTGLTTLAGAEEWLDEQVNREQVGFAAQIRNLSPEQILTGMLRDLRCLKQQEMRPSDCLDLEKYLERHIGLTSEFVAMYMQPDRPNAAALLDAWVGWLLCAEYVDGLKRKPIMPELTPLANLSAPLKKACSFLLEMIRLDPETYRRLASRTEAMLESELSAGKPEEMGKSHTFDRQDVRLLEASVSALERQEWQVALQSATERARSSSIWLQQTLRKQEWKLIEISAELGAALARHSSPLKGAHSLTVALERYTGAHQPDSAIYAVDQAHRHFEQERSRLLVPRLTHFGRLAAVTAEVRAAYYAWADQLAREFNDLCSKVGFLPDASQQQREIYEQVVHPLVQRGSSKVAYFLVDGLRYEMAEELSRKLQKRCPQIHLKGRYAELPTKTSVGMNAVAPLSREGRLKVSGSFQGFRAGEYVVQNWKQRLRAMGERSLDSQRGAARAPQSFNLAELRNESPDSLKGKVHRAGLIVVHSREIDSSGESDFGAATYDTWLGQLSSAINLARHAGVTHFVITADHGFLMLDEGRPSLQFSTGPQDGRRYAFSDVPTRNDQTVSVPLQSLGYEDGPAYVVFPRDSSTFAGKGALSFAHGGNSLQERVIPVLELIYKEKELTGLGSYVLEAEAMQSVLGHSRIKVRIREDAQTVLSFENKVIPISMRAVGVSERVQVSCKEVYGAVLQHQQFLVTVGAEPAEVLFTVQASSADDPTRAAVELFHPDGSEKIASLRLPQYFDVVGHPKVQVRQDEPSLPDRTVTTIPPYVVTPQVASGWEESIQDPGHRQVLMHLARFGNIEEAEITKMLGSGRKTRQFAVEVQDHMALLPFTIAIESDGILKRYIKKG